MNFTETEEQQALRKAVAELGRRYGHEYTAPSARAREPLTELWHEAGKSGFLGLNLPEQYGGGGGGMYELAIVGEELNAAGCGLLMMVVSPAISGTDHRPVRHRRAEAALAARHRRRRDDHGVRHHRARRRLELAQHHDHRASRRQRLAAHRPQDLRLRRRPRRRDPHRRTHRGRQDRPAQAGAVRVADRHARLRVPRHRDGHRHDRQAVHAVHGRRAAAGRRAHRRGGRRARAAVRRPQPGTDHGRGRLGRHGPLRAGQGGRLRQRARGVGASRSAPTRAWPIRWPRSRSSSSRPS